MLGISYYRAAFLAAGLACCLSATAQEAQQPSPVAAVNQTSAAPKGVFQPAPAEQPRPPAAENPATPAVSGAAVANPAATAAPAANASPMPVAGPAPVASIAADYRIAPNDLLEIEVLNLDVNKDNVYRDTSKRLVRVNASGAITMPLVGGVIVAGLTAQEAEAHLAARYEEKYLQDPQVSIFIKEFTTERITIDGAVIKPGIYPLTGQSQMTLLRALALAGGFGPIANSTEVMVFRIGPKGERLKAVFDVDQIRSGKEEDPFIKGEDLIVVQRDSARRVLKDSLFRDILDSINPFR